jgi:hypothetical protein
MFTMFICDLELKKNKVFFYQLMRQYNFLGHDDFGGSVGKGKQTIF